MSDGDEGTEALAALARQVVASPSWRWPRGAIALGRRGMPEAWFRVEEPDLRRMTGEWAVAVPDLTDRPTLAAIEGLVAEAIGADEIFTDVCRTTPWVPDEACWVWARVGGVWRTFGKGPTRAGAIVDAVLRLEAR